MAWVLAKNEEGKLWFVALPGRPKSYVRRTRVARKWPTREAAEAEACGNEHAREVTTITITGDEARG